MKRRLVWHPSVHSLFLDELAFFLVTVTAFPKDQVYRQLEDYLARTKHTAYRIYRVFGSVDLILRVWVARGTAGQVAHELEELSYVQTVELCIVDSIPHHWKYVEKTLDGYSLANLSSETVFQVQSAFSNEDLWDSELVQNALEKNWIRYVDESPQSFICFTGIVSSRDSKSIDLGALLNEIYELLKTSKELEKTAVFQTHGKFCFLIKCEVENCFSVGAFVRELSHRIAVSRCGTVTSILLDQEILGREEIGWRSIQQAETKDLVAASLVPEIYENEGVSQKVKLAIVRWIREEFVLYRDGMSEQGIRAIQECLKAIVNDDEDDFLSALGTTGFGPSERRLRDLQGPFIAKVAGDKQVRTVVTEALKKVPDSEGKQISKLSLGDRLEVFRYTITKFALSEDADITSSWGEIVNTRDLAAHYLPEAFANWRTHLTALVRFHVRCRKLISLILQVLGLPEGQ